jgi:type VI protein secretion system component VasK
MSVYDGPDGLRAVCRTPVDGRYPLGEGATTEMPHETFSRLFASRGTFDDFVN